MAACKKKSPARAARARAFRLVYGRGKKKSLARARAGIDEMCTEALFGSTSRQWEPPPTTGTKISAPLSPRDPALDSQGSQNCSRTLRKSQIPSWHTPLPSEAETVKPQYESPT